MRARRRRAKPANAVRSAGRTSRPASGHQLAGDDEDLLAAHRGHRLQPFARGPQPVGDARSGPARRAAPARPARPSRALMRSRTRAAMRRGVRGDDAGAHRHVAARQAGRVAPARRREARGGRPVAGRAAAAPPATASTRAAATTSGQVADRRHRAGRGRPRPMRTGSRAARAGRGPRRARSRRRRSDVGTTTHGRSTKRSAVGRRVAAGLAPGHRVAAHEAQPERGRAQDDGLLRARDVGDDGVRVRGARRHGAGQLVELCQAVRGRAGEDDQVGALDRRLRRRGRRDR